jgi:hypothetical protein
MTVQLKLKKSLRRRARSALFDSVSGVSKAEDVYLTGMNDDDDLSLHYILVIRSTPQHPTIMNAV